jgi:hypothetical protein
MVSALASGLRAIPAACLAVSAALLLDPAAAMAAGPAPFLAHQAAYDLTLKVSRRSPSVEAAEGRIVYNFSGSECEGYTTDFRQVSRLNTGEGRTVVSDLRSTSWEEGKGAGYRFKIETRLNNESTSSVDGSAERTPNGIVVKLKQPQPKTFTIDKEIVFPTEQVHRILEAARAEKSILELGVYDGSDDGEKIYNTLTVIGQAIPGTRAPSKPDVGELLRPQRKIERRRADAGLRDVIRTLRERRLPRADARLQRLRHRRRNEQVRREGDQAV